MEPRLLLSADLVAQIDTQDLPETAIVPGVRGVVAISLANIGNELARGTATLRMYASLDPVLSSDDTLLGQALNQRVNLQPGQNRDVNLRGQIPASLPPGQYYFIIQVEPGATIADANASNNISATAQTYQVIWQFGIPPGDDVRVNLTVEDADGTRGTFTLTGNGYGAVTPTDSGWNLVFIGTNERSNATIRISRARDRSDDGILSLNDLRVVGNPIGRLTATNVAVSGDITIDNTIAALTLGNVGQALTQQTINILGSGASGPLTFDRMMNISLDANGDLRGLTATDWTDPGDVKDSLNAPSLGMLTIRGKRQVAQGDLQADITLTDAGAVTRSARVAGWVDGATFRTAGSLGAVTLGGMRQSNVYAGVNVLDGLPGASDLTPGSQAAIQRLTITGIRTAGNPHSFIDSNIAAPHLGALALRGVQRANSDVEFGVAGIDLRALIVTQPDGKRYVWPNRWNNDWMDFQVVQIV